MKMPVGTRGRPKFNYGDVVSFELEMQDGHLISCTGTIEIIDKYGTFFQNEEPSYDIMVDNFAGSGTSMFCKHINESALNMPEDSNL